MRGVARDALRRVCAMGAVVVMILVATTAVDLTALVAENTPVDYTGRIALGDAHTCAIHNDNAVWCWGSNLYGQLGLGSGSATSNFLTPQRVPTFGDGAHPQRIVAGKFHTCALLDNGAVWCWGRNGFGSAGGSAGVIPSPQRVVLVADNSEVTATAVFAGGDNTCALLENKSLLCWGMNTSSQLGNGEPDFLPHHVPTVVTGTSTTVKVSTMSIGGSHMCAIDIAFDTWCWGANSEKQSTGAVTGPVGTPTAKMMEGASGKRVALGAQHTCVALTTSVACFGLHDSFQAPEGISMGGTVLDVVAGGDFSCVRPFDAAPRCWGSNSDSQLGTGVIGTNSRATAEPIAGLDDAVIDISAGSNHICAVISAGSLRCWGDNNFGQLGLGNKDDQHTATAVSAINIIPVVPEPEPEDPIQENTEISPPHSDTAQNSPVQQQATVEAPRIAPTLLAAISKTAPQIQKISIKKGRALSAKRISRAVSLSIPKRSQGTMRISIVKGTRNCRFVGTSIRAVRKGTCTVSVSVLPKKGKPMTRKTTITVR